MAPKELVLALVASTVCGAPSLAQCTAERAESPSGLQYWGVGDIAGFTLNYVPAGAFDTAAGAWRQCDSDGQRFPMLEESTLSDIDVAVYYHLKTRHRPPAHVV